MTSRKNMSFDGDDDDDLVIEHVPFITIPPADDPKWIKNAKGQIVGYENTRTMTRKEFEKLYGK